MMRAAVLVLVLALLDVGCQRQSTTVPAPPPPPGAGGQHDPGFAIKPRPPCSADVVAAVEKSDVSEIERLGARGAAFTCGPADDPLPLDDAVTRDNPSLVTALLEAHADPTARWYSHGDRFPLQEAIEIQSFGGSSTHRDQIIQILLSHGADPNQRWCPFESRGVDVSQGGCVSRYGLTALMWAAGRDEPATTFILLGAGADPTLENQFGANAFDLAHGEAVFYQLASSVSARLNIPHSGMLRYFAERHVKDTFAGPWDETPLGRAIVGQVGGVVLPPPPPPLAPFPGVERSRIPSLRYPSLRAGRVKALLAFGADPNTRLTWGGVDWTPLGMAVAERDADIVRALLRYGADPKVRWCVPVRPEKAPHVYRPEPGCTEASGMTPLMFAASTGDLDVLGAFLERHDVDLGVRDWKGRTAEEYAQQSARMDAVYELKRAERLRDIIAQHSGLKRNRN